MFQDAEESSSWGPEPMAAWPLPADPLCAPHGALCECLSTALLLGDPENHSLVLTLSPAARRTPPPTNTTLGLFPPPQTETMRGHISAGHEIRYGKQLARSAACNWQVNNASNYDYCPPWSFLPFQNSPQWSRISMIVGSPSLLAPSQTPTPGPPPPLHPPPLAAAPAVGKFLMAPGPSWVTHTQLGSPFLHLAAFRGPDFLGSLLT